jgi:hypothetical protein
MKENRNITHLDLKNNRINATGAHIIANIIRNNHVLSSLDLRWNDIGNSGAKTILAALQDNYTLISVEIVGNSINEEILYDISNICKANREKSHVENRRIMMKSNN